MRASSVTYITEDPAPSYANALWHATTRAKLSSVYPSFKGLADDASEHVKSMTEADFKRWRVGMRSERKGVYAGDEWAREFGAVMMPEKMFRASMVAEHFKVLWGLAFRRLTELGWPAPDAPPLEDFGQSRPVHRSEIGRAKPSYLLILLAHLLRDGFGVNQRGRHPVRSYAFALAVGLQTLPQRFHHQLRVWVLYGHASSATSACPSPHHSSAREVKQADYAWHELGDHDQLPEALGGLYSALHSLTEQEGS